MADYHLWHPAYISTEPLVLECFVTLGDAIFLSSGTDEFVQAALEALGLLIEPLAWRFEVMRTHYFNSYRDTSHDWRDAWDLVWRLRATLESAEILPLAMPPGWGYFDINAIDVTYNPFDGPENWGGWRCLIIADAFDLDTINIAQRDVMDLYPDANCVLGKAYLRYPQLRCDLGFRERYTFEEGSPDLEALLKRLVESGASVHFHDKSKLDALSKEK